MSKPAFTQDQLKTAASILDKSSHGGRRDYLVEIASTLGIPRWTARKLVIAVQAMNDVPARAGLDTRDPLFRSQLLRAIRRPTTVAALAKQLSVAESDINSTLLDLEASGYILQWDGTKVVLGQSPTPSDTPRIVFRDHFAPGEISFGVVADMHLGSKAERLDVLNAAYDAFEIRGLRAVVCPGNYIDGESRFNRHELKVHGIADQCQYAIDNWPSRPGITTYYIDGDDHEGWYHQREGVEFGRFLELEAKAQGRNDLVYMGYQEADFSLKVDGGTGESIVKIIHAGGGSAYAYSYASQKMVEAFQGGEKPAVAIIGHYHKMEYCLPRNVHCLQAGCCQDQTHFMRKRKLAAHVGFCIVTIQQDITGSITRFVPEFFPFWDRGYYLRRNEIDSQLRRDLIHAEKVSRENFP